jgi:hypothetical protein
MRTLLKVGAQRSALCTKETEGGKDLKRTVAIILVLVLTFAVFPALTLNCGSGDGENGLKVVTSPEGKLTWTETDFAITYSPDSPLKEAYRAAIGGELRNTSEDTVWMDMLIVRLYNANGDPICDNVEGRTSPYFEPTPATSKGLTSSFTCYPQQEGVSYKVMVDDGKGNVYIVYDSLNRD